MYTQKEQEQELHYELQYAHILNDIMMDGHPSGDRTGTGTYRLQSKVIHVNVAETFPIILGKKTRFDYALIETVWMLSGRTSNDFLEKYGVKYWKEWANESNDLPLVYGKQMRDFGNGIKQEGNVDQLTKAIDALKSSPDTRRANINLWNPAEEHKSALSPCHFNYFFSSFVNKNTDRRMLDLHLVQRSADVFLGVPYNTEIGAIFLTLMAEYLFFDVGYLHHTLHDAHIYINHFNQVDQYIDNIKDDKKNILFGEQNPKLVFSAEFRQFLNSGIFRTFDEMLDYIIDSNFECLTLEKHESYPQIKAKVAV